LQDETLRITLIGGPTALLEIGGLRFLTDPTFDAPGTYEGRVTLTKTGQPAMAADAVGEIDAVLLSHDQHFDNLDRSGRAMLARAKRVLTTKVGAGRLGGDAQGLAPWEAVEIEAPGGRRMRVAATPARHGPVGVEPLTGEVVGFTLAFADAPRRAVYVSGDTVWYEGVAEVARDFDVAVAVLFTGSAKPRGAFHVTMDANDAIEAAHAFKGATIVAIHNEGWAHFTETQSDLARAFAALGLGARLQELEAGVPVTLKL